MIVVNNNLKYKPMVGNNDPDGSVLVPESLPGNKAAITSQSHRQLGQFSSVLGTVCAGELTVTLELLLVTCASVLVFIVVLGTELVAVVVLVVVVVLEMVVVTGETKNFEIFSALNL